MNIVQKASVGNHFNICSYPKEPKGKNSFVFVVDEQSNSKHNKCVDINIA